MREFTFACNTCGRDLGKLPNIDAKAHLLSHVRKKRVLEKYTLRYGKYLRGETECWVCGRDLSGMREPEAKAHLDNCYLPKGRL